MNLPNTFEEKMKHLLGEEYEDYLKCYEEPRHYGLRVNINKISVEDFLKIAPWPLRPVPWISNGFYYDGDQIPAGKASVLFCRTVLSAGAKRDDTGRPASGRAGRPGAGCMCRSRRKGDRAWGKVTGKRSSDGK